jgi:hypothetical protein
VGLTPYNQSYRNVKGSNNMLWVVEPLICQPHLKSKVQSGDSGSNSVSDQEGLEDTPAYQVLGTMHLGLPPWAT